MRPRRAARAVIFDFDGVLADTEALHCAAFQEAVADYGITLPRAQYFARYLGLPDRDCLVALCADAGRPVTAADLDGLFHRKRAAFARLAQDAHLYAGVADTLRRLHTDWTLAVASGAFRDEIDPILERGGVRSLFDAVIGAEDVRAGKPAPDPFLEALRRLAAVDPRLTAAACVVVEDSPLGITAAHAAGMRCIAVTTNHPRDMLADADAIIAHLRDLRVEDLA